ncbi:MAG: Lrp/AsnC family transcriptional regulator [Selenomonadaceae bacterium]
MLTELQKKVIRVLQKEIPLTPCPFAVMASSVGITEEEFIKEMKALKERKILRRVGAVIQHRRAGFMANALCVFNVPADRVDVVGSRISQEKTVSHCYTRKTTPEWPYNFYIMVHATTHEKCEEIANRIAQENDLGERVTFYSVKEWKKESMKYFVEE